MCKLPLGCPYLYAVGLVMLGVLAGILIPRWNDGLAQSRDAEAATGAEARLRQLNVQLPPPSRLPRAIAPAVRVGDLLFVSGHGPAEADGKQIVGRLGLQPGSHPAPDTYPGVGPGLDVKQGRAAAR